MAGQSVGRQSALNGFGVPLSNFLAGAKGHGLKQGPSTNPGAEPIRQFMAKW